MQLESRDMSFPVYFLIIDELFHDIQIRCFDVGHPKSPEIISRVYI